MEVGRNASCPCGSKKKYKKCCLQIHQKEMANPLKQSSDEVPHFIIELNQEIEEACDHALAILEKGDLASAKKLASQLNQKYPKNHNVLFLQGNCFIQEEKFADAITSFEKAIDIFPIFSEAIFNLANLYQLTGELTKAAICLQKIIKFEDKQSTLRKMAKKDLELLKKLVKESCGFTLEKYAQAEEIYKQAFRFLSDNKYDESISLFQQSLQISPNHVQTYGNMALAYSGLGYHQKALECLDKALSIDPDYTPARVNRELIVKLSEGEKMLNVQVKEVHFYLEQAEKVRTIGDRLTPIKI